MMKTSYSQFSQMVDFMERYGDLSKPSGGPRGRQWCLSKWQELSKLLNSDGTGDIRTDEKWRKVWSDLKNNTKKKWAKLQLSAKKTGGGPALKTHLSDIEHRVLTIIGVQAAIGMDVTEVGFEQQIIHDETPIPTIDLEVEIQPDPEVPINDVGTETTVIDDEEWNIPGTSSDPPPKIKKWSSMKKLIKKSEHKHTESAFKAFIETDKIARENEREKLQMLVDLEKERMRQRDVELQLQARWLDFMNDALAVMTRFMEEKKRDE